MSERVLGVRDMAFSGVCEVGLLEDGHAGWTGFPRVRTSDSAMGTYVTQHRFQAGSTVS